MAASRTVAGTGGRRAARPRRPSGRRAGRQNGPGCARPAHSTRRPTLGRPLPRTRRPGPFGRPPSQANACRRPIRRFCHPAANRPRRCGTSKVNTVDRQEEFVLRTLEERDIRFVRLWFTDVLGTLKSIAVAPAELEGAFADGIGFDGSAIEGFARMFCDILLPDGSPSYADPRWVLKRNLARASDLGFTFYAHPEIEFFLL